MAERDPNETPASRLLRAIFKQPVFDCPECVQGKHGNCDGMAWDFDEDGPTPCTCALDEHQAVPVSDRTRAEGES